MAGRTAAYGRACYQWAVKRGSLATNPFQDLPLTPVAKRERVLPTSELRAIWRATEGPGSFNAIVRSLILTGQRREEVAANDMGRDRGRSLDMDHSGRAGEERRCACRSSLRQAQAILRAAPRHTGADLVFPGLRGPFNGFSKAKVALDKASGVKEWRLHDLRRTFATGLQKLGVRLEVTESRAQPHFRYPRRDRGRLPASQLGRREARCVGRVGRARGGRRRGPRAGGQRTVIPSGDLI